MPTFKQMEVLYCIVQLGSFEAASSRLKTTQSAVSEPIQESSTPSTDGIRPRAPQRKADRERRRVLR